MKKIIAILIMASLLMPIGVGAESIESQIARIQALINELQIKLDAMKEIKEESKEVPEVKEVKEEKPAEPEEKKEEKPINKIKTQEEIEGETPRIVPEGFMRRARA